jgi:hypothetical protein
MCSIPVTFGGGSTITNLPSGLTSPSPVNSGLKKPSFSHHEYQADSTASGLYALYCGSSKDLRIFFSPNGVSSTYSGRASSTFFSALAFFSLVLLGPSAGFAFAACAFFAKNFACFSAFLRSLSSSFSLLTFFSPASAGAEFPTASALAASITAAAASDATFGGACVTGPVSSPTALLSVFVPLRCGSDEASMRTWISRS